MPATLTNASSSDLPAGRRPAGLPPGPHRPSVLIRELIEPERIACGIEARSKKHCLELLSLLLAGPDAPVPAEEIFARLVERERLGCTSLARGAAFPHCRVPGLPAARGALLRLAQPLEFDAVNGGEVDLVFGLALPEALEADHYQAVDRITALLADEALLDALRAARDDAALYRTLVAADRGAPGTENARHG